MTMEEIVDPNRAVLVMEAGPPGSPCRRRAPSRRSETPVKSRGGKRPRKSPHVGGRGERREDEHARTFADAPEREKDGVESGGVPLLREKGAPLAARRKPEAACARSWRRPAHTEA